MVSNNELTELKEMDMKNRRCYSFDDISNINDHDVDVLLNEK